MSTVNVVSPSGKSTETAELPDEIFDAKVNVPLMHQVVVAQLAAARQGTHATKTRGEVRGGGGEAVPAEGHRPGPPGFAARPAVRRRWRCARPAAAVLRPADAQEDEGGRAARCPLRPGPARPGAGGERVRRRRRAADQGRAGRAGHRYRAGRGTSLLVVLRRDDELARKSLRNAAGVQVITQDQLNTYDVLAADHVVFTAEALEAFVSRGSRSEEAAQ